MLSSVFLSGLRVILRSKLYASITLVGLVLGITSFLALALIVKYEESYDSDFDEASSVYRVDMHFSSPSGDTWEAPSVSFVAYPYLAEMSGINLAARVLTLPTSVAVNGRVESETVTQSDVEVFKIFKLQTLSGDLSNVTGPRDVAIPASVARKYFGSESPIGRLLTIGNAREPSRVVAVYRDFPLNSSVDFGIIHPFDSETLKTLPFRNWGSNWGKIWIKINSARDVSRISKLLLRFVDTHRDGISPSTYRQYFSRAFLSIVPLSEVHFYDASIGAGGSSRGLVGMLALIGLSALAAGVINYVNLSTARASLRAREVAMRKVLGASRRALFTQFVGEAFIFSITATGIALALTQVAIRLVNAFGGWSIRYDGPFIALMAVLVIGVSSIGGGAYPAFVLARFSPASVLASSRLPSGGRTGAHIRQFLVIAQFAFASILAICSLAILTQASFVQNMKRGFSQDDLIIISSLDNPSFKNRQSSISAALSLTPGIVAVSRSDVTPHHLMNNNGFRVESHGGDATRISWGYATRGYFSSLGVRLLAGRLFDDAHGTDIGPGASGTNAKMRNVVITELAATRLGFRLPQEALNAIVYEDNNPAPFQVIGVIEDLRFNGPLDSLEPLLFMYTNDQISECNLVVKYVGIDQKEAVRRLYTSWNSVAPDVPFLAKSVREIFSEDYRDDRNHGLLLAVGTIVAITIAGLGLYGLAVFSATMRRHEIGIRKVLGARTKDILIMLVTQFAKPVVIANIIAWPIAWMLISRWLSSFEVREPLTLAPFAIVSGVGVLIAVVTVLGQATRLARAAPATTLRSE